MGAFLFPPVPAETSFAVRQIFAFESNPYLKLSPQVDALFSEIQIAAFDAFGGESSLWLAGLVLTTLFQYEEVLTDWRAVEAYSTRTDWKYALHLPLQPVVPAASELCELRRYLRASPVARQELLILQQRLASHGFFRQRELTPGALLRGICALSRYEKLLEALRRAFAVLAVQHTDWLRGEVLAAWYGRYARSGQSLSPHNYNGELHQAATELGQDIHYLLNLIEATGYASLASLPELIALNDLRREHYLVQGEKIIWRENCCISCEEV